MRDDSGHNRFFSTAVLIGLLVGCGHDGNKTADSAATRSNNSRADRVVNLYNWADLAMLEKFTKETGIKINYDVYDSTNTRTFVPRS